MDYAALKAELAEPKYKGLSDAEIVAALVVRNIPTVSATQITPSELFSRFTPSEARAVEDAKVSDNMVFWFYKQLDLAQGKIDLSDTRIVQGLGMLAQKGLVAAERLPQITAGIAGPDVSRAEQIDCGLLLLMDDRSRLLVVEQARSLK